MHLAGYISSKKLVALQGKKSVRDRKMHPKSTSFIGIKVTPAFKDSFYYS